MSLWEATAISFVRAALLSLVIAELGWCLFRLLQRLPRRARHWSAALLLLPFLSPTLLTGYGYRGPSLALVHNPLWNELLYDAVLLSRLIPLALLVILCLPAPSITPTALHISNRLSTAVTPSPGHLVALSPKGATAGLPSSAVMTLHLRLSLRRWLTQRLPVWALGFLLVFQESEIAALMQVDGWPETIFSAHAGGLPFSESLRRIALPAGLQFVIVALVLVLWWNLRSARTATSRTRERPAAQAKPAVLTAALALFAALIVLGVGLFPWAAMLPGAVRAWHLALWHASLWQEIGYSILFGASAGLIAAVASWLLILGGRAASVAALLVSLPGLAGGLVLGLALAALFSQPALRPVYDTPLPLVLGLALWLLPRAMLLGLAASQLQLASSRHVVELLADSMPRTGRLLRRLQWTEAARPRMLMIILLCWWGTFELMLGSILHPPGLSPATIRLYNLMHYGHIDGLSAMMALTLVVPLIVFMFVVAIRRAFPG